jgi:DNA-binding CsgD family transcriptional regulator
MRHYKPVWGFTSLSHREKQIIALLTEGMTNAEIGKELGLQPGVVKNYLSVIFDKTGMSNRCELALWAVAREAVREYPLIGLAVLALMLVLAVGCCSRRPVRACPVWVEGVSTRDEKLLSGCKVRCDDLGCYVEAK